MAQSDPTVLLTHGLHLGHRKNKIHPKAQQYIHSYQEGTSIIDLFKTAPLLDAAKAYLSEAAREGKTILIIATKKVSRQEVSELCTEHNIPFITNKWVAGFLTNFAEVSRNIARMNALRTAQQDGSWNELPKHERTQLEKKLNKIASIYGGVAQVTTRPDIICIVDIKREQNALNEATQLEIPTIAMVDTNVNPEQVTHPIPANDDAISSVTYVVKELINAYIAGKA